MEPEGAVADIDLVRFFVTLGREGFTGALRFENEGIIKIIYFKGGYILSASTNDRIDSLDEILLRSGTTTREHVRQALSRRKENETLGDALLGLGFISRKELASARRIQVANLLRSLLGWRAGAYALVPDYLPRRSEGTIFATDQIVLEVVLTSQERERVDEVLDGGTKILRKAAGFDERYVALDLNEDADEIVSHIDGVRSASGVAAESSRDAFSVYKLLIGLEAVGLLEARRESEEASETAVPEHQVGNMGETAVAARTIEERKRNDQESIGGGVEEIGGLTNAKEIEDVPLMVPKAGDPVDESTGIDDAGMNPEAEDAAGIMREPELETKTNQRDELMEEGGPSQGSLDGASLGGREAIWRDDRRHRRVVALVVVLVAILVLAGGYLLREQAIGGKSEAGSEGPRGAALKLPEPNRAVVPGEGDSAIQSLSREGEGMQSPAGQEASTEPTRQNPVDQKDEERARYERMAQEFIRTSNPSQYTIQFELVCQNESVAFALDLGGNDVWFATTDYGGRRCFRVFWGSYPDPSTAERAVIEIPARLRGGKPVVLQISEVISR